MNNSDYKVTFLFSKFKEKIKIKDENWLYRYIKFSCFFDKNESKIQKHHILPKSLFPEFQDFLDNPWNLSKLSIRAHIIAHYMLAKAIGGNMWAPLIFYSKKYTFNSRVLEEIILNNNKNTSERFKNTISAFDTLSGIYKRVDKNQFITDDNLVGQNKGRKDIGLKISKSLKRLEYNGRTIAQNRALSGKLNPMYGENGEKNPFFGKKHSDETKKNISAKNTGKKMEQKIKNKISISCKKPKINKENYSKYIYIIYNNDIEIFRSNDQRNINIFLIENKFPSLYTLKKKDTLNFKFRKFFKTNIL